MRGFVFLLLAVVTFASPQSGYNYEVLEQYNQLEQYAQQQQQLNQQQELQQRAQMYQAAQGLQFNGEVTPAQYFTHAQPQEQSIPQLQPIQPLEVEQPAQLQPVAEQNYQQPQQPRQRTIQYNKDFFFLSAPLEEDEEPLDFENQSISSLKKNIRVLFIRTPEQKLTKAAIQLAKQAIEQKTVVYVLTKQHTAAELASKIQQIPSNGSPKPEVVFIKYRTPEEADQAQRQIQSQYETLKGQSRFHYEGPAPTHNFIGSASKGQIDPRGSVSNAGAEGPGSEYLPAALKQ